MGVNQLDYIIIHMLIYDGIYYVYIYDQ